MAVINELIRSESNGAISFGNYLLDTKSKLSDFEHNGDLYKVKTFKEIPNAAVAEQYIREGALWNGGVFD